jgi:hypothetical protein
MLIIWLFLNDSFADFADIQLYCDNNEAKAPESFPDPVPKAFGIGARMSERLYVLCNRWNRVHCEYSLTNL